MELDEFISKTLTQIVKGVADSRAAARTHGGYVSPSFVAPVTADGVLGLSPNSHPVFAIDFDVAVIVSEEVRGEAGAKISVASMFSAGAGGAKNVTTETTSRIKFRVPLELPVDSDSRNERDSDRAMRRANDAQANRDPGDPNAWMGR